MRDVDVSEQDVPAVIERLPLPDGWRWGEVAEVGAKQKNAIVDGPFGSNLKLTDYVADGTVPVLTTKNLAGKYDDLRFISEQKFQELKRSAVYPNDILMAKIGSCGKTGIYPVNMPPAIIPANLLKVTLNENFDKKFVFHYFNSRFFQRALKTIIRASAQPAFGVTSFRKLPFPIAPLSEQLLVVAEIEKQFSRLDEAVANLQRVKANLKRYKASVLKAAVEGRLVETDSAAKGLHDLGNWIPIGSVIQSLDQGWSPQCENEPRSSDLQWAVMKTTAVQPMQFLVDENKRLTPELTPREHLEIVDGDLLITRAGPRNRVGITCLVRATAYRLMLCDKAYRLRTKLDAALPAYLEVVLNSPILLDSLDEMKSGISDSGLNLTQKRFAELSIPLPPLVEQARIVAEVDRHLSIIREVEAEVDANLQRAQALRQGTLARAFSSPESGGVFRKPR